MHFGWGRAINWSRCRRKTNVMVSQYCNAILKSYVVGVEQHRRIYKLLWEEKRNTTQSLLYYRYTSSRWQRKWMKSYAEFTGFCRNWCRRGGKTMLQERTRNSTRVIRDRSFWGGQPRRTRATRRKCSHTGCLYLPNASCTTMIMEFVMW